VAICGHQLTHPTPSDSFMSYVSPSEKTLVCEKGGVVVCASHMSAFDVKGGAKVCAGPATQPLNSVILEIAPDNTVWAVGILGQEKFVDYFDSYADELKEFYKGEKNGKKMVSKTVKTVPMNVFTKNIVKM
jgi:nitrite reductase/ring-hydroxylating ferredoxin subunit